MNNYKLISRSLLIYLVINLMACSDNKGLTKSSINSQSEYFSDQLVPDFLKTDEYIAISRIGSIEWSSTESILIVPSKMLTKDRNTGKSYSSYYIKVNYFNNDLDFNNGPVVEIYRFKLGKTWSGLIKGNKHPRSEIESLYESGYGEGHCANYYVIRKMSSDSIIYVNRKSSNHLKKIVTQLFNQISPQEHFQSLSLSMNCVKLNDFADSIMFNKGNITSKYKYVLPYIPPIKYGE